MSACTTNVCTITSRYLSLVRAYTLAATFLAHALLTAVGTHRRAAALSALVEPRAARTVAVPLRRPYTPLLEPPILKHDFLCRAGQERKVGNVGLPRGGD